MTSLMENYPRIYHLIEIMTQMWFFCLVQVIQSHSIFTHFTGSLSVPSRMWHDGIKGNKSAVPYSILCMALTIHNPPQK